MNTEHTISGLERERDIAERWRTVADWRVWQAKQALADQWSYEREESVNNAKRCQVKAYSAFVQANVVWLRAKAGAAF